MRFIPTKDHIDDSLHYAMVSDDGKFVVGIYTVLFGFRIRAGFADDTTGYELDYCAGDRQPDIELIFGLVLTILAHHKTFRIFPRQRVKPMHNDPDCMEALVKLAKECPENITVQAPDIHKKGRGDRSHLGRFLG